MGRRPTETSIASKTSLSCAALALEGDVQAVGPRLDRGDLGLEQDLLVALLDALGERRDDVAVGARHQLVHHFDDGDLRAERAIDRRHLQPDDAAAEDQQPLGRQSQLQRVGRVPDARVMRDEARRHRLRAGGDDRRVEADERARPSAVTTASVCGEVNAPSPVTTVTLRWRARPAEAAGQALDDALLPAAQRVEVDAAARAKTTPRSDMSAASSITLAACSSALEGMQPTLRQTPPSVGQRSTSTTLAEIGGAEGGGVAARPGAEHQHVAFEVDLRRAAGAARRRRLVDRRQLARRRPRRPPQLGRQQRALAHLVADLDLDLADDAALPARARRASPCRFPASS